MFDALLHRYRFHCPTTNDGVWIAVSAFRRVRRLRGASTPAVFRLAYDCTCGDVHEALITHDTLDYEPLATSSTATFVNLLTGSRELLGSEMSEFASMMIRQGHWPWTFYCHPESAARPGFPSSLRIVAPLTEREHSATHTVGVLVRCHACERHSVNLVSRNHLDVPYFNDEVIHYVDRMIGDDSVTTVEAFRHQLSTARLRSSTLGLAS